MQQQLAQIWAFHPWSIIAAGSAFMTLASILADRRRTKRRKLDKVGFMPWTGISIMATLVTVVSIALAIRAG